MNEIFELSGRTALVTGSSRGIGRAIALTLGRAGARVVFHGSRDGDALQNTVREARSMQLECDSIALELSQPDAAKKLAALEPDILVLNASVQSYATPDEFDGAEFVREFTVNFQSCCELVRDALPAMRRRRFGRVIAIGSVNQNFPAGRLSIYGASKAALANFMRSCAKSFAAENITFNTIVPGVIATDRNRAALSDGEFARKMLDGIPAGRFGAPEDCAGAALLFASEAGAYITGAELTVAGGMNL